MDFHWIEIEPALSFPSQHHIYTIDLVLEQFIPPEMPIVLTQEQIREEVMAFYNSQCINQKSSHESTKDDHSKISQSSEEQHFSLESSQVNHLSETKTNLIEKENKSDGNDEGGTVAVSSTCKSVSKNPSSIPAKTTMVSEVLSILQSKTKEFLWREQDFPQCSSCGKIFGHKSLLKVHMRIHTNEGLFECSVCERSFRSKYYLKRHMFNRHIRIRPPKKSQYSFTSSKDSIQLQVSEEVDECSTPSEKKSSKPKIVEHPNKLVCDLCGKVFVNVRFLNRHIQRHTMKKPFQCNVCRKEFFTKSNFKVHAATHMRENM